jgi:hypothetical protein
MKQYLEKMAQAHERLEIACADYEAACIAHESHCETMQCENALESLTLKLVEEHSDLILAMAAAQLATSEALLEHLHVHHNVPR